MKGLRIGLIFIIAASIEMVSGTLWGPADAFQTTFCLTCTNMGAGFATVDSISFTVGGVARITTGLGAGQTCRDNNQVCVKYRTWLPNNTEDPAPPNDIHYTVKMWFHPAKAPIVCRPPGQGTWTDTGDGSGAVGDWTVNAPWPSNNTIDPDGVAVTGSPYGRAGEIPIPTGYNVTWCVSTAIFLMLAGGYLILRRVVRKS